MATSNQAPQSNEVVGGFGPMAALGLASIGAGAIHAAAAATHGDAAQASVVFQALALAQLGWGAWALVGHKRSGTLAGLVLALGALAGWVVVQTVGLGFVDGLNDPHAIGWADLLAAGLAATVAAGTARQLLAAPVSQRPSLGLMRVGAISMVAVTTLAGVAASSNESHSHRDATNAANETVAGRGHSHSSEPTIDGEAEGPIGGGGHAHGGAATAAVPPVAYNPEATAATSSATTGSGSSPVPKVDLSGVAGVSPEQQRRAEELVEINLEKLPQWSDQLVAKARGFHSIGDGFTGHEHLINWSYINDDKVLDPDYPESLVYDTSFDPPKLVSAMYMLAQGSSLSTVPDIGGPLTQWHIHDNLCFTDGAAPRVAGLTDAQGNCRAPSQKLDPVPMIHVWIVSNPCGPFSALEGIAAGQVKAGETQACFSQHDHAGG